VDVGGQEEHVVVAEDGRLEDDLGAAELSEKPLGGPAAEQVEVLFSSSISLKGCFSANKDW
jgi:hypothetical protein